MTFTTHSEAHASFRESLRETPLPLTVAGVTIDPATALAACDPTAYRSAYLDWADWFDIDLDSLEGVDGSDPRSADWDGSGTWR